MLKSARPKSKCSHIPYLETRVRRPGLRGLKQEYTLTDFTILKLLEKEIALKTIRQKALQQLRSKLLLDLQKRGIILSNEANIRKGEGRIEEEGQLGPRTCWKCKHEFPMTKIELVAPKDSKPSRCSHCGTRVDLLYAYTPFYPFKSGGSNLDPEELFQAAYIFGLKIPRDAAMNILSMMPSRLDKLYDIFEMACACAKYEESKNMEFNNEIVEVDGVDTLRDINKRDRDGQIFRGRFFAIKSRSNAAEEGKTHANKEKFALLPMDQKALSFYTDNLQKDIAVRKACRESIVIN
jgi:predicted Zn-ribbon and HTH transcriptional regulator